MEYSETIAQHQPDESRRFKRDFWLSSFVYFGVFALTIATLFKFRLPFIAQIALGLVILALPVSWGQSYGQWQELCRARESQPAEMVKLARKLLIASLIRPATILIILLQALWWTVGRRH
jgi:cell division protein FtsW (lipid II flippase)